MSASNPKLVLTLSYHPINENLLLECHHEMDGKKATIVDNITRAEYETNLAKTLKGIVERLKRKGYKADMPLEAKM